MQILRSGSGRFRPQKVPAAEGSGADIEVRFKGSGAYTGVGFRKVPVEGSGCSDLVRRDVLSGNDCM